MIRPNGPDFAATRLYPPSVLAPNAAFLSKRLSLQAVRSSHAYLPPLSLHTVHLPGPAVPLSSPIFLSVGRLISLDFRGLFTSLFDRRWSFVFSIIFPLGLVDIVFPSCSPIDHSPIYFSSHRRL